MRELGWLNSNSLPTEKFSFFFWLRWAASRILVPQPGFKPVPSAGEAQNLDHWTVREVPEKIYVQSTSSFIRQSTKYQPTHSPKQQLESTSLELGILDVRNAMMN